MATHPFENTNAPPHPFVTNLYKPRLLEEARLEEADVQRLWEKAGEAGRTSRSYVLITVLLAGALFPASDGNGSFDAFLAYAWQDSNGARLVVAVNYAAHPSQCYVRLPFSDLGSGRWRLRDLLGEAHYERDGNELKSRGLFLDVPPWQYHVFEMVSG